MGYTHYFYKKPQLNKVKFDAFRIQVSRILEHTSVPIGDGAGNGLQPDINDERIAFNGIGADSHETFYIERDEIQPEYRKDEQMIFNFCKTNRKPYDKVVVACLIAFKDTFGKDVSISSDGSIDDWREGIELYELATGKKVNENKLEGLN